MTDSQVDRQANLNALRAGSTYRQRVASPCGSGGCEIAPAGSRLPRPSCPRTCLVVDPSQVVRKVARRIFETMQFETREAETGQEALQTCAADMPDAILLDGHLATMSSVAMLATLRALPNGRKPCILYCTTENDTSALARALSAGADDYLLKPLDRESIRAKLDAAGVQS